MPFDSNVYSRYTVFDIINNCRCKMGYKVIILSQNEILALNEVGECWPWGWWRAGGDYTRMISIYYWEIMEWISLKKKNTIHVKGTSLSKHLIQLTCPGTFSLVGRVSAPGNRSSWVRSRATTYQSYQMVLGTQAERVELGLVDPVSG